jgi:hypothetical protein
MSIENGMTLRTAAESRGWTVAPRGVSAGHGRKRVVSPEGTEMLLTAGALWDELRRREGQTGTHGGTC